MTNTSLYIITVLIWGSTWLAIEYQLGIVAPEVSIVYRYASASLILFLWCRLRHLPMRFNLRAHGWFILLGLFLFCLNYLGAYRAQNYITSALTAIVFSTIVWLNIINARIFFGIRSDRRVLFGAVCGVAGIVLLFAPQVHDVSLSDNVVRGCLLAFAGALGASFGNIISQAAQKQPLPILQSNAWGMFYGALITAAIAVIEGRQFTFDVSIAYILSLAYLSIFGSVVAFGAYLTLLGRIGAHRAGYAMVLFPVIALLLSWLFEGLKFHVSTVFGIALVLLGNLFVLQLRNERGKTTTMPPGLQHDS